MPASATRARFEEACAQIGAGLGDFGFRYLRSKRQAKKVIGEWTQVVSFQSSFRNTADHVRLGAWYWIDSDQVGRWRHQHGALGGSERVFGCALGYLGDPAVCTSWNVAGNYRVTVRRVCAAAALVMVTAWGIPALAPAALASPAVASAATHSTPPRVNRRAAAECEKIVSNNYTVTL